MRVQEEKVPFTQGEYWGQRFGCKESDTRVTVQIWPACSLKGGWVFKLKKQVLGIEDVRTKVWGFFRLRLSFFKEPGQSLPSTAAGLQHLLYSVGLPSTVPPRGSKTQQQEWNTPCSVLFPFGCESLIDSCLGLILKTIRRMKENLGKRYWTSRNQLV